ncbi:MAG: BBP7 family outer membrane beta-barrel protein, partial [Thermoguttaceae bacterium]
MKSYRVIGTVLCTLLCCAVVQAVAAEDDYTNYLRLANSENALSSDAGMAFASSEQCQYAPDACGADCFDGCGGSCGGSCADCCPQWEITGDYIIFDRVGNNSQPLVRDYYTNEVLKNTDEARFGFHGGPRVSLIRHGCRCYDLELLYFQIDGWNSTMLATTDELTRNPISFPTAEGSITTIYPMQFQYTSQLYNSELNLRWNPLCRVAVMAGFRWAELNENFNAGILAPDLSNFWNTRVRNNLYGFQIGADAILYERGCFSIDGLLKAGVYNNHAEQTSTLMTGQTYPAVSASTDHVSFLGELGLQAKYQLTCNLTIRAGYEALWIDGVALAPSQIPVSYFYQDGTTIDTRG